MKRNINIANTSSLLSLSMIVVLSACSTTGMQRSQDVQSTMKTVDNDIKSIVVQLDAINASLDELTKPGQADRMKAFELFSDNASEIKEMENRFARHAEDMESSGRAYFDEWASDDQEYDNAEIQRRSDERRISFGRTYDKIAQNNVGVKDAFKTYVSDVNEIERFLSNDLTSAGMNSITEIADDVVDNGTYLKNELQKLQGAIEQARVEMSQS